MRGGWIRISRLLMLLCSFGDSKMLNVYMLLGHQRGIQRFNSTRTLEALKVGGRVSDCSR